MCIKNVNIFFCIAFLPDISVQTIFSKHQAFFRRHTFKTSQKKQEDRIRGYRLQGEPVQVDLVQLYQVQADQVQADQVQADQVQAVLLVNLKLKRPSSRRPRPSSSANCDVNVLEL